MMAAGRQLSPPSPPPFFFDFSLSRLLSCTDDSAGNGLKEFDHPTRSYGNRSLKHGHQAEQLQWTGLGLDLALATNRESGHEFGVRIPSICFLNLLLNPIMQEPFILMCMAMLLLTVAGGGESVKFHSAASMTALSSALVFCLCQYLFTPTYTPLRSNRPVHLCADVLAGLFVSSGGQRLHATVNAAAIPLLCRFKLPPETFRRDP